MCTYCLLPQTKNVTYCLLPCTEIVTYCLLPQTGVLTAYCVNRTFFCYLLPFKNFKIGTFQCPHRNSVSANKLFSYSKTAKAKIDFLIFLDLLPFTSTRQNINPYYYIFLSSSFIANSFSHMKYCFHVNIDRVSSIVNN